MINNQIKELFSSGLKSAHYKSLMLILNSINVDTFFELSPSVNYGNLNFKFNPSLVDKKNVFWGAANAVDVFNKLGVDECYREDIFVVWLGLIGDLSSKSKLVLVENKEDLGKLRNDPLKDNSHSFLLAMLSGEISQRSFSKETLNAVVLRILDKNSFRPEEKSIASALKFLLNKNIDFGFSKDLLRLDITNNPQYYVEHLKNIVSSNNVLRGVFIEKTSVYPFMDFKYNQDFNSLVGMNSIIFMKNVVLANCFSPNAKKFASNLSVDQVNTIKKIFLSVENNKNQTIAKYQDLKTNLGLGNSFKIKEKINLLSSGFNPDEIIPSLLDDNGFELFMKTSSKGWVKNIPGRARMEIIKKTYTPKNEAEDILKKSVFMEIEKSSMNRVCHSFHKSNAQEYPCVEFFNLWIANTLLSDSLTKNSVEAFLEAVESYKKFSPNDLQLLLTKIVDGHYTRSSSNQNPVLIINDFGNGSIENKNVIASKAIDVSLIKKELILIQMEKFENDRSVNGDNLVEIKSFKI